jgi:hypothetical protein
MRAGGSSRRGRLRCAAAAARQCNGQYWPCAAVQASCRSVPHPGAGGRARLRPGPRPGWSPGSGRQASLPVPSVRLLDFPRGDVAAGHPASGSGSGSGSGSRSGSMSSQPSSGLLVTPRSHGLGTAIPMASHDSSGLAVRPRS